MGILLFDSGSKIGDVSIQTDFRMEV